MKKICIATIVLAMAILASCGGANKESKTEEATTEATDSIVEEVVEEPSFLVKSIEINYDVAGDNKVTFEYDELDRLIKVTSHRRLSSLALRISSLISSIDISAVPFNMACALICSVTRFARSMRACSSDSMLVSSQLWDGYMVRMTELDSVTLDTTQNIYYSSLTDSVGTFSFDSVFYKYGDVDRPNIDVLAFAEESGFLPGAASVAPKGMVSKFMPMESKTNIYSDAHMIMATSIIKYTYTVDDYQRVTGIEYEYNYYDGEEEESGSVSVKVNY